MRQAATLVAMLLTRLLFGQSDLALTQAFASNSTFSSLIGRMPTAQIADELVLGGIARNYGPDTQTSVMLNIEVMGPVPSSFSLALPDIAPGDSIVVLSTEVITLLAQGTYTVFCSLTSDQTPTDPDLSNNEAVRYFGVDNGVCALDGVGVIPLNEAVLGSLGTSSFAGMQDGLALMSYIDLKTPATLTGFEALLAPGTQPGGFVVFAIADTADILGQFVLNPIATTDAIDVTNDMVANGRIQATPLTPVVLPAGGYYVSIMLFSSAGAFPIGIIDDLTYARGSLESQIYLVGDQVYPEGNALAVRMLTSGAPTCHADYVVTQAVDGIGDPLPFMLNLVNTSSADTPDSMWSWLWDFGDGSITTDQYPSHTYATNGPYEICLTINDGLSCTSTFCDSISVDVDGMFSRNGFTVNVTPDVMLGMSGFLSTDGIRALPNPTEGSLSVGPFEPGHPVDIVVLDASARQVIAVRSVPQADLRLTIDLQPLRSGVYALRVSQNGRTTAHRVIRD